MLLQDDNPKSGPPVLKLRYRLFEFPKFSACSRLYHKKDLDAIHKEICYCKSKGIGVNLTGKMQDDIIVESTIRYYRVDRKQIGFLKFILEACDGLVTLSTVDAALGLVSFRIPPGCEGEVAEILKGLQKDVFMEPYVK